MQSIRKISKLLCINILIFFIFESISYAETPFNSMEQVKNYTLSAIASTDKVCIASAGIYITKYENGTWSDAVYVSESGYKIADIHATGNAFYMLEYNKDEQKGQLLKSADGETWEMLTQYNTSEAGKFMYDNEGNILIRCEEDTVLPDGFARYTRTAYEGTFGSYSTEFQGSTIALDRTGWLWYSITDANGTVTEYPFKSERKTLLRQSVFNINGAEYIGTFPAVDSQYYVFSYDDKYFRVSTSNTGVAGKGNVFYFEVDDSGKVKRDDDNRIACMYIECPYTFVSYIYTDGKLYAEFLVEEGINPISEKPSLANGKKEWYYTEDFDEFAEWTPCEKPMKLYNMAETYEGEMKIRFKSDGTIINVLYENQELQSSSNSNMIGDLYKYFLDDNYFYLSEDGIYYVKYDLPDDFRCDDNTVITEDGDDFVIQSGIYQLRAPKADVYAKLDEESEEPMYVVYDNELLAFEEQPVMRDDRTLIPLRFLFEQMGAEVTWNQDEQTATVTQDNTAITVGIDDTVAEVNGQTVSMDVPAQLINDKTMVTVRFLSEELGYDVSWDGENRIITIE